MPQVNHPNHLALYVVLLAGCGRAEGVPSVAPPFAAVATPTSTEQPRRETRLALAGDLRPAQSAELAFKIGGQLRSFLVRRGARVARGQLLALLVDREARAQLSQAQAALAGARARAALAADQLQRTRRLTIAQASPESQLSAATHEARAAQAAVAQGEAAVALARAVLANHQLRAPFAGQLVRVPDGPGAIVAAGTPIARIEQLDRLVLHATVAASDLGRIREGDTVSVGGVTRGRVRTIVSSLETTSRRMPVEIELANPRGLLNAGAYVRGLIEPEPAP